MEMYRKAIAGLSLVLIAACGGTAPESGGDAPGGRDTDVAVAGDWAKDACKTLPAAAAAAAAGIAVSGAELSGQNVFDHTALSTCNYNRDGEILAGFTVGLRHDKTGDGTMAKHIAELSAEGNALGPVETVPVGKGQARWMPQVKQLVYFPDDARVVYVVGPGANVAGIGPKSEPDAAIKPRALKIALAAAE